jgi:hypothetical protein
MAARELGRKSVALQAIGGNVALTNYLSPFIASLTCSHDMSNISTLIETYAGGAKLIRDALRSTAHVDLDARPIKEKWSVREVVCHLADAEIVYADRMKRVIAENNPTFFEADPNLFGPALHCPQRSLDREFDVIEAIRAHMLPILQSCDATEFQRTGIHSLDGPMTLRTLLQRITDHIPHHVAFIEEKLQKMAG